MLPPDRWELAEQHKHPRRTLKLITKMSHLCLIILLFFSGVKLNICSRCHFHLWAASQWSDTELSSYRKTKTVIVVTMPSPITCSFIISSKSWSFCLRQRHHTHCCCVFSSFQYCKAWSHLALDRGACHPHTVIIPELTSPLSIELLRRWRGHKIPCRERQHCSCPGGLRV